MSAILVRNMRPGPTTLTPDPNSPDYIVWQGHGDADGADVQLVSEAAAASMPFQRAVARQLLKVEGDDLPVSDAVSAHLQQQAALAEAQARAAEASVTAQVVRETDNDLLGLECIGPNPRGTGQCGQLASVPSGRRDQVPPLCLQHQHLVLQFVPEEFTAGNETVTKWVRVQMGDRERQVMDQ